MIQNLLQIIPKEIPDQVRNDVGQCGMTLEGHFSTPVGKNAPKCQQDVIFSLPVGENDFICQRDAVFLLSVGKNAPKCQLDVIFSLPVGKNDFICQRDAVFLLSVGKKGPICQRRYRFFRLVGKNGLQCQRPKGFPEGTDRSLNPDWLPAVPVCPLQQSSLPPYRLQVPCQIYSQQT